MRISDWSLDVCSSDLALQDRLLPLARRALLDLQMRGHVLDRAQELEVEHANALEHMMAPGIIEGERGHPLFDHCGAPAILDLVEQRAALALAAEHRARARRPAQHGGLCKMEDDGEAESIRLLGVNHKLPAQLPS